MAQIKRIEGQVEIKCNADKFFHTWAHNTTQVAKMCPKLPKIELLEGENCHTLGSIIRWTFVTPIDGKFEYVKTVLEEIDEEKKSFTYELIEGEVMEKYYKSWKEKMEVIPKENCSIVKWTIFDCEKKCEDAPDLEIYLDFLLGCLKDSDRHLCSV